MTEQCTPGPGQYHTTVTRVELTWPMLHPALSLASTNWIQHRQTWHQTEQAFTLRKKPFKLTTIRYREMKACNAFKRRMILPLKAETDKLQTRYVSLKIFHGCYFFPIYINFQTDFIRNEILLLNSHEQMANTIYWENSNTFSFRN